jgi:hypothetical protein
MSDPQAHVQKVLMENECLERGGHCGLVGTTICLAE